MMSKDSEFSSHIQRLYDARFITGADVEKMILRNTSSGADARYVKELCFLFALYILQPCHHPTPNKYTTICLSRLGRASGEAGLSRAVRDLCKVCEIMVHCIV